MKLLRLIYILNKIIVYIETINTQKNVMSVCMYECNLLFHLNIMYDSGYVNIIHQLFYAIGRTFHVREKVNKENKNLTQYFGTTPAHPEPQ